MTATPTLTTQGVSFVLLLNKEDELREKLRKTPFSVFEPTLDPSDASDPEFVISWIADRFRGLFKGSFMEPIVTTATDLQKAEETLDKIFKLGY